MSSYDSVKSSKRPKSVIESPELAAGKSNVERAVKAKRSRPQITASPTRKLSNQLKIDVDSTTRDPLAFYDSVVLPLQAPEANPPYSKKSPERTVGKSKP
jgi:hypothetical protein